MPYVLRFVQRYRPENRDAFMELEREFASMEQSRDDFPKGRRLEPYSGREPTGTLICEFTFPTLTAAQEGLAKIESDPQHEELYRKQVPYMEDAYTEFYRVLEF